MFKQDYLPYYKIDNDNKNKFEISQEYNKIFKSREHIFMYALFYFITITTYSCICRYNSYVSENLLEIPLILLEEEDNFTFGELLA